MRTAIVSPGFQGRPRASGGQYLVEDFPVLSAGPTPRVHLDRWEFVVTTGLVAELRVYSHAPGVVARCPGCDEVVLRLVRGPRDTWLDLRGTVSLRIPLLAPPAT